MDYNQNQKHRKILYWDHQQVNMDQKYILTQLAEWAQKEFNLLKYPAKNTLSDLITKHRYWFYSHSSRWAYSMCTQAFVTYFQVKEALMLWVLQRQHQKVNLNWELIKAKGCIFLCEFGLPKTTLQLSDHRMDQFEEWNAFHMQCSHYKSGSADISSSKVQAKIVMIKHELAKYPLCDQYSNINETGLFYNMSPNATIVRELIEVDIAPEWQTVIQAASQPSWVSLGCLFSSLANIYFLLG